MPKKSILVISVSGIGNTVLQSPLIHALLDQNQFSVDVLFRDKTVQSIFEYDNRIHAKLVLPKGINNTLRFIRKLRKTRYDYSIACFPSNQIGFHLLAFLAGAKNRIIHAYPVGKIKTLSFLSNIKVPISTTNHDVEQNLNLLASLSLEPNMASKKLLFSASKENDLFADQFIAGKNLKNIKLIGIHPGCKYSQRHKRWPKNKFIELINRLNDDGVHCLLFAGPDEMEHTNEIYQSLHGQPQNTLITESNLNNIGSLISKCLAFVSTDSGLGHIAIAKNVNTLAIFGPANKVRTAPYGEKGGVITLNTECSPCMGYPFTKTHSKIRCPFQFKCLNDMTVQMVYSRVKEIISS